MKQTSREDGLRLLVSIGAAVALTLFPLFYLPEASASASSALTPEQSEPQSQEQPEPSADAAWSSEENEDDAEQMSSHTVLLGTNANVPAALDSKTSEEEEASSEQSGVEDSPTIDPGEVPSLPGQSNQPAPESRKKTVIEAVHTDAISVFLDDGKLVLDSKADIDGLLGKRLSADSTTFFVSDLAKTTVSTNPVFGFLGEPGETIWRAPQVQNREIIWPGFSTEDPKLREAAEGGQLSVRLTNVVGPGKVEVYLVGDEPERLFSSQTKLPDWKINIPQHVHMNWVFTKPGTYSLSFQVSGLIDGKQQSAAASYTFVVGSASTTTTSLIASAIETAPGEALTLTAKVDAGAVGAVQFRDVTRGSLLGHSPVKSDGTAAFRTDSLPSGKHKIVAEFIPTWSTDFGSSKSPELEVTVFGEQLPQPVETDTTAPSAEEVAELLPGTTVTITTPSKSAFAGTTIAARVDDKNLRGQWISVWFTPAARWLGWIQLDMRGNFSVQVPPDAAESTHRLVVKARDGEVVGWDNLLVTPRPIPIPPPAPSEPDLPPEVAPEAATKECLPAVTLDHGHIDAFTVSAGGGMAVLQLLEDVTGHRVLREADSVLLRVKEPAYSRIPSGVPGGPTGYVLPLSQNSTLIWPGWDTNRTSASGFTDVAINVTNVSGPGQIYLYTLGGAFGGWSPLLTHGGFTLPGTIREPSPAHTHAQWVFTQKGIYLLTAHAVATNPTTGEQLVTASHRYVFQVGDVPLGDVFCSGGTDSAAASAFVNSVVQKAALDAIAAAQADAELAKQESAETGEQAKSPIGTEAASGLLGPMAAATTDTTMSAPILVSLAGGGLLMVLGIAGLSGWYVRRIGEKE